MDLVWSIGVASTDRWVGNLDGVLVEDGSLKVTGLVIKRGLLLPRRLVVDLAEMEHSDEEGLHLSLSTLDFLKLPKLQMGEGSTPRLALGTHTRVLLEGGRPLRLRGVRFSSASQVLDHLIVGLSGWLKGQVVLPLNRAQEVTSEQVPFNVQPQELAGFPRHGSDLEIEKDVWETLYEYQADANVDLKGVVVRVSSGAVTLEGNVRLSSTSEEATRLVGSIQEVPEVENHLLSDWDVELAAASAISWDGRNQGARIAVHSSLGTVTLRGTAPSDEAKRSVISTVEAVPGVQEIEDAIVVEAEPVAPSGVGEPPEATEGSGEPEETT